MKVFLDTSVLLAACGSATGASRTVVNLAPQNGWSLLFSPYVEQEVQRNLSTTRGATGMWLMIRPQLASVRDEWSLDRPVVFTPAKDRPVLFTANAHASVLLTLDQHDFQRLLGDTFYGLAILRPGEFLNLQRSTGRLVE